MLWIYPTLTRSPVLHTIPESLSETIPKHLSRTKPWRRLVVQSQKKFFSKPKLIISTYNICDLLDRLKFSEQIMWPTVTNYKTATLYSLLFHVFLVCYSVIDYPMIRISDCSEKIFCKCSGIYWAHFCA